MNQVVFKQKTWWWWCDVNMTEWLLYIDGLCLDVFWCEWVWWWWPQMLRWNLAVSGSCVSLNSWSAVSKIINSFGINLCSLQRFRNSSLLSWLQYSQCWISIWFLQLIDPGSTTTWNLEYLHVLGESPGWLVWNSDGSETAPYLSHYQEVLPLRCEGHVSLDRPDVHLGVSLRLSR